MRKVTLFDDKGKEVQVKEDEAQERVESGELSTMYPRGNATQETAQLKVLLRTIWVYDANGKATEATATNAEGMISEGGGFSVIYPKGTPEQEAAEFKALVGDPDRAAAVSRASLVSPKAEEVHTTKRRHTS